MFSSPWCACDGEIGHQFDCFVVVVVIVVDDDDDADELMVFML